MDIVLPYDVGRLRGSDEGSIQLYKYDSSQSAWVPYASSLNQETDELYMRVGETGYYMMLANR